MLNRKIIEIKVICYTPVGCKLANLICISAHLANKVTILYPALNNILNNVFSGHQIFSSSTKLSVGSEIWRFKFRTFWNVASRFWILFKIWILYNLLFDHSSSGSIRISDPHCGIIHKWHHTSRGEGSIELCDTQ